MEQITPAIQEPTPLNKANLETPLGEIRIFSNSRNDDKYLLCDGSRIYVEDYPELSKIIPKKYTYDTLALDTAYGKVTQVSYFPQKSLYIMVRQGVSDSLGFGIFTSTDGNNWILRYTSTVAFYNNQPTIQYMPELNLFVGVNSLVVVVSSDGYNWTLTKSLSSSGDYRFNPPIYSPTLGKALLVQYDTDSTYYTYLYSTTDFVNFETLCTKSGNYGEVFFSKVIEADGKFYSSGYWASGGGRCTLFTSTDNAKTFTKTSYLFNTDNCVKFGEYWYSCYKQSNMTTSPLAICRTKDFENFEVLGSNANNTSLLGVINGYLFYRINGVLTKRDLNDNATEIPDTDNLKYLPIRKEYIKIMNNELYCSNDFVEWKKYDDMPTDGIVTALYTCSNGSIFVGATASTSYYDMIYTHNEKQINLPTIDIGYAYIKAYLNESEGE